MTTVEDIVRLSKTALRDAVYNPHGLDVSKLPTIFGFNSGGEGNNWAGVLLAESGKVLGTHACSNESWMYYDLGIIEGSAPYRHEENFKPYYPNGYRMEFVSLRDVLHHPGLQRAFFNRKAAVPYESMYANEQI